MYSDNEKVVLCGASAYEQKYYFNQDFASLPQSVQDELHVMCVMFTVEIGGIFIDSLESTPYLLFRTGRKYGHGNGSMGPFFNCCS